MLQNVIIELKSGIKGIIISFLKKEAEAGSQKSAQPLAAGAARLIERETFCVGFQVSVRLTPRL
jgi:hypothetical protein